MSGSSWAAGAPLGEATKEQKLEAQREYLDAKKAFDSGSFAEALEGFRASYDVVASPNSHHMIVRTLRALGKTVDAYVEAEVTVTEANAAAARDDKYQQTAVAARSLRDELRAKIALLTVTVEGAAEDATLTVGGESLDPSEWGVARPVEPGTIAIILDGPEGAAERQVKLAAGGQISVAMSPAVAGDEPPPPAGGEEEGGSSGLRIASYVFGGLGLAGWGLFAGAGAMHLSEYNDLRDRCQAGVCPPGVRTDIDRGQTYQTLANVGAAVGSVGLATGVVLFIASQPDVRFDAKGAGALPTVAVGPGTITVEGQF